MSRGRGPLDEDQTTRDYPRHPGRRDYGYDGYWDGYEEGINEATRYLVVTAIKSVAGVLITAIVAYVVLQIVPMIADALA